MKFIKFQCDQVRMRTGKEMTQQLMAVKQPWDLSSNPGTHRVERELQGHTCFHPRQTSKQINKCDNYQWNDPFYQVFTATVFTILGEEKLSSQKKKKKKENMQRVHLVQVEFKSRVNTCILATSNEKSRIKTRLAGKKGQTYFSSERESRSQETVPSSVCWSLIISVWTNHFISNGGLNKSVHWLSREDKNKRALQVYK